LLYQGNLDPIIIDCEQPPVTVAWLLRDLLTAELPKMHDQGPPIIRDTLYDEQGIYFDTPIEIRETDGVFVLQIRGSVWTWDGERYLPNNEHVDVLDIEILPSGTGGSKVRLMPAFALGGIEKHIESLLASVLGKFDGALETTGHRVAKRLDDAVDRAFEDEGGRDRADRLPQDIDQETQFVTGTVAGEDTGCRVGQESDKKRLSKEVLDQLTKFTITHEARLKTAPTLLIRWLNGEARHSPIVESTISEPESGVFSGPTWKVCWGMELLSLFPEGDEPIVPSSRDSPGPGRAKTLVVFELLELSQNPNLTKVIGRCVAHPEVAEHFDRVWSRMLAEFPPGEDKAPASDRTHHLLTFEEMGYRNPLAETQTGHTIPAEATSQATVSKSSEDDSDLKPLDRAIIKVVRQIEDEGLKATDERVATRLSPNPQTNESYHRVTISRHRCKLRDRGFEV